MVGISRDPLASLVSSLTPSQLAAYVMRQIGYFFPDDHRMDSGTFESATTIALSRYSFCCAHIGLKYYQKYGHPLFDHMHSDQYAMVLYYLSRALFESHHPDLASRVYYLNKALHALDIFYEVVLPEVFLLSHPVGTVLGRASYGKFLAVYQNCTVGSNAGAYPRLGENVVLYAGATVVGKTNLGDNTIVSAHGFLRDETVPSNSVVFGSSPHPIVKPLKTDIRGQIFQCPLSP